MKSRVFLDTNLLIYLYSEDEVEKSRIVARLVEENDCIISLQVVNEFANVLIKKFKVSYVGVLEAIKELTIVFTISNLSISSITNAIQIHHKYKLSYYDSLIVSSAQIEDCTYLYSEDMHNSLIIGEVLEIRNPFLY